jgi:hypothetical protein
MNAYQDGSTAKEATKYSAYEEVLCNLSNSEKYVPALQRVYTKPLGWSVIVKCGL